MSKLASQRISGLLRGVFAGAGSDGLNEEHVASAIVGATGITTPENIRIAYLGTAIYDLPNPRARQTALLAAKGCQINDVAVADPKIPVDMEGMQQQLETAHVIIVSGGNTLFALDRWKVLGIDQLLHAATSRGCVMAGGSAGAICWFDGGHSDSMDPDTFFAPMTAAAIAGSPNKDESSAAPSSKEETKRWDYIRLSCLGFLPGLVCPHHDRTQSNGILRAVDFDKMLKRHPGEQGICIDHWAALVVEGDKYHVLSVPGKPGSVGDDESFQVDGSGTPGIWLKQVNTELQVKTTLLPKSGCLSSFLFDASTIMVDPQEEACRLLNPAV